MNQNGTTLSSKWIWINPWKVCLFQNFQGSLGRRLQQALQLLLVGTGENCPIHWRFNRSSVAVLFFKGSTNISTPPTSLSSKLQTLCPATNEPNSSTWFVENKLGVSKTPFYFSQVELDISLLYTQCTLEMCLINEKQAGDLFTKPRA